MNLTDIYKVKLKRKKKWRRGRGLSSGSGKTSGRGNKGQGKRSGVSFSRGFTGGQMPLIRCIPKRGFNNAQFKKVFAIINVKQLDVFSDGEVVDAEKLKSKGLIKKVLDGVKILGSGAITKKLVLKVSGVTKNAAEKIKKAGGTVEIIK